MWCDFPLDAAEKHVLLNVILKRINRIWGLRSVYKQKSIYFNIKAGLTSDPRNCLLRCSASKFVAQANSHTFWQWIIYLLLFWRLCALGSKLKSALKQPVSWLQLQRLHNYAAHLNHFMCLNIVGFAKDGFLLPEKMSISYLFSENSLTNPLKKKKNGPCRI